jgi:predicted TIM-barrel fold metal-dependent hydrolase
MRPLIAVSIAAFLALPMPGKSQAGSPMARPGATHPAIDIHAHTFNLRYLPVEGILRSFCVPSRLARPVAHTLESMVVSDERPSKVLSFEAVKAILERDPMNRQLDPWLDLLQRRLRETRQAEDLDRKKSLLMDYVGSLVEQERAMASVAPMAPPPLGAPDSSVDEEEPILDEYLFEDREASAEASEADTGPSSAPMAAAASAASLEARLASLAPIDLVIGILKKALNESAPAARFAGFVTILLLDEEDIFRLMKWNYPGVQLFLSQMMDMEVAYRDEPVLRFDHQTKRMKDLASRNDQLLWFAAYDPLRIQDLALVRGALQQGAIGFKVYPPSGYRPSNNRIPSLTERGLCKFLSRRQIKKQHASRYGDLLRQAGGDPAKAGGLLDEKIGKFLDLAQKERFAILSHHTPHGFEAADSYGLLMSHPCLWGEVLKKRPDLLLILGHAGGGEAWFGNSGAVVGQDAAWDLAIEHPLDKTRKALPFDRQAYNLCVTFPNVYCDLGYSMEVLNKENRRNFETRLKRLAGGEALTKAAIPKDWDFCQARDIPPRYDLREKILYGSDWMMPEAAFVGTEYFKAFKEVFDGELAPYRHLFFGENARSLLCRVKNPPGQLQCGESLPASR